MLCRSRASYILWRSVRGCDACENVKPRRHPCRRRCYDSLRHGNRRADWKDAVSLWALPDVVEEPRKLLGTFSPYPYCVRNLIPKIRNFSLGLAGHHVLVLSNLNRTRARKYMHELILTSPGVATPSDLGRQGSHLLLQSHREGRDARLLERGACMTDTCNKTFALLLGNCAHAHSI